MREIKFRAWDKSINKMITQENVKEMLDKSMEDWEVEFPYSRDEWYPAYEILAIFDYFNDIQKQEIKRYEPSENRFEIMQYTGLQDKNGKEIYEGDIVKSILILDNGIKLRTNIDIVEWNNEECSFMLTKNVRHFHNHLELEVIGNIYDNPDLLERERNIEQIK